MNTKTKRSCVAFIPARAGSTRVKDKNIRVLSDHPLLAYSVSSAIQSGVFEDVIISTDSQKYADIAAAYGANVPFLRPVEFSNVLSTDFEWLYYTLNRLYEAGYHYDCFAILRPTNPFRSKETILRAWGVFKEAGNIDSLRAVEKCSQHPGKMWVIRGGLLTPILPYEKDGAPWQNHPYQALPDVYIQNASLEIAWSQVVLEGRSISGTKIFPFITEGYEGFDINEPIDFDFAEYLVKNGLAVLPALATNKKRM